jgi:hypothetical protein
MRQVSDDERYVLWRVGRDGAVTACEGFVAEPAGTIDEFRFADAAGETAGFRVSVERGRTGAAPGRVVYETR